MAIENIHIKPKTQITVWTPRTHTRFEYDAMQPYSAQRMIITKNRTQTAGNAEPCGIADGFLSIAYDDTPSPECIIKTHNDARKRDKLSPTALITNVTRLHQNMILRVIMT